MKTVSEIKVGEDIKNSDIDWIGYYRSIIGSEYDWEKLWVLQDMQALNTKAVFISISYDTMRCLRNDYYKG